jgi:hypothetical protein
MPQNVEAGHWLLAFVLLASVFAMVAFFATSQRRTRNTISLERAEREGLVGEEGLARAQRRHEEHG